MTKEEVRAEQQARQEKCMQYRSQLQSFLRSQRLYKEDDAGERAVPQRRRDHGGTFAR